MWHKNTMVKYNNLNNNVLSTALLFIALNNEIYLCIIYLCAEIILLNCGVKESQWTTINVPDT